MVPMSSHYEVVFSCLLHDATPERVLSALRWHLGEDVEEPGDLGIGEFLYPLLVPNPNSRLPGGDCRSFQRRVQEFTAAGEVHAWELYSRNYWVDDHMLDLTALLDLIAPHVAEPGYGGHYRNEFESGTTPFVFRGGTYDPVDF